MTDITSLEKLENALSEPTDAVIECFRRLDGDLLVLGVGGKMGPSLARMAKRASDLAGVRRRIIGVARFSVPGLMDQLRQQGIEVRQCDLLEPKNLEALPEAANVLFMAGMKFGTTGQEPLTWAMNTYLPALVCSRFPRSRIVAFSTGNVYGLEPASREGSLEPDTPAPVGEYAMSCLGRERIFEHFSRTQGTPVLLVRLNYACDLRYGVLVDLARKILSGEPIDLRMSWFNTIWQGDANAMTLRCFEHTTSPASVLNLTGPERLNVRNVCEELGRMLGTVPTFTGTESDTALLSNAGLAFELLGKPRVSAAQLLTGVAAWVRRGGQTLNKPTHFESRDGKF